MKKRIVCLLLALVLLFGIVPPAARAEEAVMTASQALIDKMKAREGFRSTPYWDNSHYSIGYGTTCPDDKVDYYKKNPMSKEEAEAEFKKFLTTYENSVRNFAKKWDLTLKQHQFDALVSFSYNCGSGWMSSTSGYFNTAVRQGDVGADLLYGMTLYSTSGGAYILIGRRLWEANMYINGEYGEGAKGNYPDNYRWVFLDGNGGTVRYKICAFDTKYKATLPVAFEDIPIGKDKEGNTFVYDFAGWYTESGKKVTRLDSSLEREQVLYARWTDPEGNVRADTPKQTFPVKATVVNVEEYANVRKGPGTDYDKNGTATKGQRVTVYEEKKGTKSYGTDIWCRIGENKWLLSYFLQYDTPEATGPEGSAISSLKLVKKPTTLQYVQPIVEPDWEGSVLLATYKNGYQKAFTATRAMISDFDGKKTGEQTVTVKYEGKSVKFPVTVSQLKAPGAFKAELVPTKMDAVKLSWEKASGATHYYVYYRKTGDSAFTRAGTTKALTYEISGLERNVQYDFRVLSYYVADNTTQKGPGTEVLSLATNHKMTAPTGVKAERDGEAGVQLSWEAAEGATHYDVRYKAEGDADYISAGKTQALTFALTDLQLNKQYDFQVVSYIVDGEAEEEGPQSQPVSVFLHPAIGAAAELTARQTAHDRAELTWTAGENASYYQVQYKKSSDKSYTVMGETDRLGFTVELPRVNVTYQYRVVSYYQFGEHIVEGPASEVAQLKTVPVTTAPENFKVQQTGNGQVKLSWEAATGATHYRAYYRVAGSGSSFTKAGDTTGLSFTIKDLNPKGKYDFRVHSYYKDDTGYYQGPRAENIALALSLEIAAPTGLKAALADHDDVKLTWKAAKGATHYNVYYRKAGTTTFKKSKTVTGTTHTITDLTDNAKYEFRVISYFQNKAGSYTGGGTSVLSYSTTRDLAAPKKVTLTLYGHDDVTVSWSKVKNATAYQVYYKKSGDASYTFLCRTSATTVKKSNLADGATYTFRVMPCTTVNGGYYRDDSGKNATVTALKKVANPKVSKYNSTKVKISWTDISGESGYQIGIYSDKACTKLAKAVNATGKSTTTKVTKNKTYYYRIRAYKTVGGKKLYAPWSGVVSFKLK